MKIGRTMSRAQIEAEEAEDDGYGMHIEPEPTIDIVTEPVNDKAEVTPLNDAEPTETNADSQASHVAEDALDADAPKDDTKVGLNEVLKDLTLDDAAKEDEIQKQFEREAQAQAIDLQASANKLKFAKEEEVKRQLEEREKLGQQAKTMSRPLEKRVIGAAILSLPFILPFMAAKELFKGGVNMSSDYLKKSTPVGKMNTQLDSIAKASPLFENENFKTIVHQYNNNATLTMKQKNDAVDNYWNALLKNGAGDPELKKAANALKNSDFFDPKMNVNKLEEKLMSFIERNKSKEDLNKLSDKLENTLKMIPEGFPPFKGLAEMLKKVIEVVKNLLNVKFGAQTSNDVKNDNESVPMPDFSGK